MSVYRGVSGEGGRQGAAGDSSSVSQTAPRGKLCISEPGQRARDLSTGPVGRAGRRAAQPAAGTGPTRLGANPVSTLGSVRAGWPGTDQPADRTASTGGGRGPPDGRGGRSRAPG